MLLGLDAQFSAVSAALDAGKLHHAWLLHGPRGVGKATFAATVAARLLAEASQTPPLSPRFALEPDHPTAHLLAAGAHPDLFVLKRLENEKTERVARSVTVDQVRTLRTVFAMTPSQGARRCVIVDSVDDLERGAANALLKALEEPPVDTIFLLVSHAPGRLLATIRSRCRSLRFPRLGDDVMAAFVADTFPDLAQHVRTSILAHANGAPGAARAGGLDVATFTDDLEAIATSGDRNSTLRLALVDRLSGKAAADRYEAFLQQVPRFLARRGRASGSGPGVLDLWARSRALADEAVAQSLPPESVVFDLAGLVAALAPGRADATA